MTEPVRPRGRAPRPPSSGRPTASACSGEYQGSGFTEPRFLVRRADGQVIQLSRLLYVVTEAIAAGGAAAAGTPPRSPGAPGPGRAGTDRGQHPLPGRRQARPARGRRGWQQRPAARTRHQARPPARPVRPAAGPEERGVLLRPAAAGAVGQALAWLHYPALAASAGSLRRARGVAVRRARRDRPAAAGAAPPPWFLAVAGPTLVSLLFHEFGHALARRYGGARWGEIGFGLYLIFASLYTDVNDVDRRAGRPAAGRPRRRGLRRDLHPDPAGRDAAREPRSWPRCSWTPSDPQELFPLVRMDGYFILGDLAGVRTARAVGAIMASVSRGQGGR